MRTWRWYSKLLFALLLLAFAYLVWPTPWRQFNAEGATWRQNRFTSRVLLFDTSDGKWVRP